jgi:phenylpropionate dioxygenase-like ring-hydroxylating dioxygenase large terminal subunit
MTEPIQIHGQKKKRLAELRQRDVFGNFEKIIEGWYWAIPSKKVRRGKVKPLKMLGRELVVYRGDDGKARIMDAYCPHMGAHLAEGSVDGTGIRCFFHHWKMGDNGELVECPVQDKPPRASVKVWPTEEKYGMIWLWAGEKPRYPVPFIPELKDGPERAMLGNNFTKGCHPNVVMVNAIDEQHFRSVHPMAASLADGLHFEISSYNENCQMFDNSNKVPLTNLFNRVLSKFYEKALTYRMVYWNGSTGSVTIGPDFWHFHIIFALRPNEDGCAEGQTILVTNKHQGFFGFIFDKFSLVLSDILGSYFAKGDTRVFQTMKWNFKTPIKADRPIIQFMKHLQQQKAVTWGEWNRLEEPSEVTLLERDDPANLAAEA